MLVVSFDVGIVNLAVVLIKVYPKDWIKTDKPRIKVLEAWHIDITQVTHDSVPEHECKLYHTKELSDRVLHVIQEYEPKWSQYGPIDRYLTERQPPQGLTGIEETLFQKFRDKIVKVSPNAMHTFFKLSADYETRKLEVVNLARPFLQGQTHFDTHERVHDMADAMCLAAFQILTWIDVAKQEHDYQMRTKRMEENIRLRHNMSSDEWFDTFRYTP